MKDVYKKNLRRIGILILTVLSLAVLALCVSFLFKALAAVSSLATLTYTTSPVGAIVLVLCIAFLAMALLQGVRSLVPFRGWFHARYIRRRFITTERDIDALNISLKSHSASWSTVPYKARAEGNLKKLLHLANATNQTTFFNLPIEQVCGQISAVAELLLSEISESRKSEAIFESGTQHLLTNLAGPNGAAYALQFFQLGGTDQSKDESLMDYKSDLRNRVAYQIQRNIDQIQIVTKTSWQRTLRLLAVAISIAIALTAIPHRGNSLQFLANGLVVGFVAGYLATVFRDMIAIVERLRR
jgi:hypothetical protein